jgi:hypothetical protein
MHTLLLSLTFGGEGFGLSGFGFPWRERRIAAPDLRVALVPAQVTAARPSGTSVKEPLQQASIDQPAAGRPTWPLRDGKGGKDRVTVLPENLIIQIREQEHLSQRREQRQADAAEGFRGAWPAPARAGGKHRFLKRDEISKLL